MSISTSSGRTGRSFLIGALSMFALVQVVKFYGTNNILSVSFVPEHDRSLAIENNRNDPMTNREEEELVDKLGEKFTIPPTKEETSRSMALTEVVNISKEIECPTNMYPVEQIHNAEAERTEGRKIPRIVHMTGKTSCLTKPFYDNMKRWSFENYSFYFHDDEAVDKLFDRDWPMFPQLKNSMECLKNAGGAAKADLWRYLALWEYGGIYTDMDNAPGIHMNATTITPGMDAFFVQEEGGFLSQYFFAVSPHHPLMFYAVHDVMSGMHELVDTGKFYVPLVTGPGTTKRAFLKFMGSDDSCSEEEKKRLYKKYAYPSAGNYVGRANRSVTVMGDRKTNKLWCRRSNVGSVKKSAQWSASNATSYKILNRNENHISCLMEIYRKYEKVYNKWQQHW